KKRKGAPAPQWWPRRAGARPVRAVSWFPPALNVHSSDAVDCELLRYGRPERLCGRDIGIRTGGFALPHLSDAASIERADELRVEAERIIVVGKGFVELAELEIHERATIEGVRHVGRKAQRFVAVRECLLQILAHDGLRPTARVPDEGIARRQPGCFLEVKYRAGVIAFAFEDEAAVGQGG